MTLGTREDWSGVLPMKCNGYKCVKGHSVFVP
jgi:hypothetical protein